MEFNDGVKIDTSGTPRVLKLKDGWYAVGNGMLIPCNDYNEAEKERKFLAGEKDDAKA